MEVRAIYPGDLEIRRGGRLLSGSFPYSSGPGDRQATVMDRGSVRKERIGPDAFAWQINQMGRLQDELAGVLSGAVDEARAQVLRQEIERRNVHILAGHDFDKPLGDLARGTARVTSDKKAVKFEVDLPEESDADQLDLYARHGEADQRQAGRRDQSRFPRAAPDHGSASGTAGAGARQSGNVQVRVIEKAVLYELEYRCTAGLLRHGPGRPDGHGTGARKAAGKYGCNDSPRRPSRRRSA